MRETAFRDRLAAALLGLALFALYLVMHPYRGIQGDALIYVTRAFASPAILHGDMLFANESQTGLTIYGSLVRALDALMPVGEAARALALAGVAVWFGGVMMFARVVTRVAKIAPGYALAMAALISLAPLGYSAGSSFATGEFLAVPRPFAEGFVLSGLALMLERRWRLGVAAMLAATAFHPLMALAGAAVAFTWAALADRRLWFVAAAGLVLALVAAVLRIPPFIDLITTFDAEWLALLRARTSYLFLSQAPVVFWADLVWRCVAIFLAARLCAGALRMFLIAVLVASALGILASLLLSDLWPSILITRLQPWRILFVPVIVAPVGIVLLAAKGEGRPARMSLGLLACAYMTRDADIMSIGFSLAALAPQLSIEKARAVAPRVEILIWVIAAAAWLSFDVANLVKLASLVAETPRDFVLQWSYLWVLRPLALPLGVLAVALAMRGRMAPPAIAGFGLALAATLAIFRFDDRAPIDLSLESRNAPALVAAMPANARPVLWLSLGKEPWYWLDRPNWVAPAQASSIVFSRELAMLWRARTTFLIERGIFAPEIYANQAAPQPRDLSPDAVAAVCKREDGPSAIIAPLRAGDPVPDGARRVDAPARSYQWRDGGGLRVDTFASYAVWPCARG